MKLTPEQLKDFSKQHICYEISSLLSAMNLYCGVPSSKADTLEDHFQLAAQNSFLECTILHARCLFEFLYVDKKIKDDDSKAIDFFPDPLTWIATRTGLPDGLANLSFRTGKEIAHLTYHRQSLSEIEKTWDIRQITRDLLACLIKFAEGADPNRLHAEVKMTIDFWVKHLSYEPGQIESGKITTGSSSISVSGFSADVGTTGLTAAIYPSKKN